MEGNGTAGLALGRHGGKHKFLEITPIISQIGTANPHILSPDINTESIVHSILCCRISQRIRLDND